jgi:hypothetical protein
MPTTKLNNGQLPTTLSSKTIDNSNDINTTTTRLKISGGSNGQVLSTDGASNLSWITAGALGAPTAIVTKTANESVSQSITLQDDDHLQYALTSGRAYLIKMYLLVSTKTSSNADGGLRLAFAGNTNGYARVYVGTGVTTDVLCNDSANFQLAGNDSLQIGVVRIMQIDIPLRMTANFTFKLRWAQASNTVSSSTIYKNSYMEIYDLGTT